MRVGTHGDMSISPKRNAVPKRVQSSAAEELPAQVASGDSIDAACRLQNSDTAIRLCRRHCIALHSQDLAIYSVFLD